MGGGRVSSVAVGVCALLACAGVCAAQGQVVGGISFADIGRSGPVNLGAYRGSLGVIDFDNDGFYDLFINDNAGQPKRLFRNVADASVPGGRTFVDVSASAGILGDADSSGRGQGGVVIFDFNNDGLPDIFTGGSGTGGSGLLLRNNGDGTFTNVSLAAGVRLSGVNALSVSAIDFDHDGWTDIVMVSNGTPGTSIVLLRNNGNGTFTNLSDLIPRASNSGTVYAHAWNDYDHDGWEDLIVLYNQGRPFVLRNVANPAGGRMFVDTTTASGMTYLGPAPMGIALGDVNNDGWIDVAITDAVSGTYYENREGVFTRVRPYGTFFGWGTTYLDADNDGLLDNYQAGSYGAANIDWLLKNNGGGTFTDARAALNTTAIASQYCARVDFDNDGREDIITINPGTPTSVYRNTSPAGATNHWITLSLRGRGSVNRDAVGARVRLTAGGVTQTREVTVGSSYAASEDPRLHFGLGSNTRVDRVEVIWPRHRSLASRTEVFNGPFAIDAISTLVPRQLCVLDYNADGVLNPDDLADYITEYFTLPALPGPGGYAIDCPDLPAPWNSGYRAAYVSDGTGACATPNPDNLGDYLTDYFLGC